MAAEQHVTMMQTGVAFVAKAEAGEYAHHPLVHRAGIRTLLLNTLLGMIGVCSSSVAVALSNSAVIYAELLRSLAEFAAVLLSLVLFFVFPRVAAATRQWLGYLAATAVTAAMAVAVGVMVLHAYGRVVSPVATQGIGVLVGMATASASAIVNFFSTRKNRQMYQRYRSSLFDSQWRLFRVKLAANVTVVVSAGASYLGSAYYPLHYADPVGSLILAGFVGFSATNIYRRARRVYKTRAPLVDEGVSSPVGSGS